VLAKQPGSRGRPSFTCYS